MPQRTFCSFCAYHGALESRPCADSARFEIKSSELAREAHDGRRDQASVTDRSCYIKRMDRLAADDEVLRVALEWHGEGRALALATVVETWGSAPRPVGSLLIVDDQGRFLGSVSGGCIEADIVVDAMDVIADGRARLRDFGVSDETAWGAGLSCGGRIKIFIERVD